MIKTFRLDIVPFYIEFLNDYYVGFNEDITKYMWPDPFANINDARNMLQNFMKEMKQGQTLLFSILSKNGKFLGSVEVHGLTESCPELGIWIKASEQKKGYAYEALCAVLDYVRVTFDKYNFFYELDIRNKSSIKLLHKLKNNYDIVEQDFEMITTTSGKKLELQGYILKVKKNSLQAMEEGR